MAKRVEKSPQLDDPDERLRWIREQRKFADATSAARRYNWNENTYRSHENGNRPLSKRAAAKYANAYKVPVAWLLFGEGSMTPPIDPEVATLWQNLDDEARETLKQLMKRMGKAAA